MEKGFFDMPIKNDQETYEQITEMQRNNDYTTGILLDYEYFSKHYKLIATNLSKQIELENFIGRFEDDKVTMFFIIEKSKETTFEFSQNSATTVWFLLHIIMETQKIVNLLEEEGNESSKFATRKWYVISDKKKDRKQAMVMEMKMVQPLNLKIKSLNQISVTIQTHIFL